MKRFAYMLMGLFFVANMTVAADVYTTDSGVLPEKANAFLKKHFKEKTIAHISIEKNLLGIKDYEVILMDGSEIEFDRAGEWKEINLTNGKVPDEIVLPSVLEYIRTRFKDNFIVAIDRTDGEIDVDLNNGVELEFNMKGKILKVDF
jgi:Protein of unknown function (DUF2874).